MKVQLNDYTVPRKNKPPIPFYHQKNGAHPIEDGTSERDRDATAHEIRYDPANAESMTYKVYVSPFGFGSPEQWLKHQAKLDLIIKGNDLTNGPSKYALARALLKGDALREFENKAIELGGDATNDHF